MSTKGIFCLLSFPPATPKTQRCYTGFTLVGGSCRNPDQSAGVQLGWAPAQASDQEVLPSSLSRHWCRSVHVSATGGDFLQRFCDLHSACMTFTVLSTVVSQGAACVSGKTMCIICTSSCHPLCKAFGLTAWRGFVWSGPLDSGCKLCGQLFEGNKVPIVF